MDITKAIIPAAGLGTRFLPFTKAVPKEMLPLIDRPAIHHAVDEALKSAVSNFFIITSKGKQAIANYFDSSFELEAILQERGKRELIADIERIIKTADFSYIRQSEPLGLGHAVLMAQQAVGKEYFSVLLPDDIIISKQQAALAQLIRIARQEKGSVLAVQEVPENCVSSYGIIGVKKQITPNLFQVSHLLEKPDQKDAPTNLAIVGRYVLSHKIFNSLEEMGSYATEGELQLTDAISHMIKNNEKLFACKVQGTRYDLGTPLGWIKAIIGFALQDPRYAPYIKNFLASLNSLDSFVYNSTKNIEHISS